MKLALTALTLLSLSSTALAEDRKVVVKSIKAQDCNTDGGSEKCTVGHDFIARAVAYRFGEYAETKIELKCGDAKKGSYTVDLMYEYNDGTVFAPEPTDKSVAKAPACVREEFLKVAPPVVLDVWKKVFALDPTIDVRTTFRFKLSVE